MRCSCTWIFRVVIGVFMTQVQTQATLMLGTTSKEKENRATVRTGQRTSANSKLDNKVVWISLSYSIKLMFLSFPLSNCPIILRPKRSQRKDSPKYYEKRGRLYLLWQEQKKNHSKLVHLKKNFFVNISQWSGGKPNPSATERQESNWHITSTQWLREPRVKITSNSIVFHSALYKTTTRSNFILTKTKT